MSASAWARRPMAQIFWGTKIFAEVDPGRRGTGTRSRGVLAPLAARRDRGQADVGTGGVPDPAEAGRIWVEPRSNSGANRIIRSASIIYAHRTDTRMNSGPERS